MRNDDVVVDKVSCESFCDLMAVAEIDTPGQTAGAARRPVLLLNTSYKCPGDSPRLR